MTDFFVKHLECKDFISEILVKLNTPLDLASRWAELLTETSLLGIDSHGIRMLERYISHVEGGGINPSAMPRIVKEFGSCANLDANGGFGHLSADFATSESLKLAKKFGISCVSVKGANHVGACGLYVRRVALQDCIGLFTTVTRPSIAPWGGKIPLLGSNPIAFSAPIFEMQPFLFDSASSIVSMGKITEAKDLNQKIPDNWALDIDGNPTTDPAKAIKGSLLPIAGHKGYGLAMLVEILSAFLSGGLPSTQVESWIQQTKSPSNASFSIIVIDISSICSPELFKRNMRSWVEMMINSEIRPGFKRIYYPGQIEAENYDLRIKNGIPVKKCDIDMFERLAQKFKISKL